MLAAHPALSPSDQSLRAAIRRARRQGLHVFLKPQVDILVGGWRGEITFSSESNWEAWFHSYRAFISHYARLAQEEGVELFSVGVELDAARHREADWRNVVQSVRELFRGTAHVLCELGARTRHHLVGRARLRRRRCILPHRIGSRFVCRRAPRGLGTLCTGASGVGGEDLQARDLHRGGLSKCPRRR